MAASASASASVTNQVPLTETMIPSPPPVPDTAAASIPDKSEVSVPAAPEFYDGDLVTRKNMLQDGVDFLPLTGRVLKRPMYGKAIAPDAEEFNVHWERNKIEKVSPTELSLLDRGLNRTSRVQNKDGMEGRVIGWNVVTTCQIVGTNHVIDRVPVERLRPISTFIRGQQILYRDWIGVITAVKRNMWFNLEGGMGFHVPVTEKDGVLREDPYWGMGTPCPGIRTKLNADTMRRAVWTSRPMSIFSRLFPPTKYLYSLANVTLSKAEITEIDVLWLRKNPSQPVDLNSPKPPTTLSRSTFNGILILDVPSTESVGIGSVRLLKLRPEDPTTNYSAWLTAFRKKVTEGSNTAEPHRDPLTMNSTLRALAIDQNYELPVRVIFRQTWVEIAWNDGSSQRIPSSKVWKVLQTEETEFPSGMVVSPLYSPATVSAGHPDESYGIIVKESSFIKNSIAGSQSSRKVGVLWLHKGVPDSEPKIESVFNIRPHSKYSMYDRGTVVFPRIQGTTKFKGASVWDLNLSSGRMIVMSFTDHSYHEVYPHEITPLPCQCTWNFVSQSWTVNHIIKPPFQLQLEYNPERHYVEVPEPSPEVLTNNNEEVTKNAWDEPTFEMLAFAPETHRYYSCSPSTAYGKDFMEMVNKEIGLLKQQGTIPEGIWVRCYENRLDLISAFFVGPENTPYEDGAFMFDLQLTEKFPQVPPKIHHVSYTYEVSGYMSWDGNFCTKLLNWNVEAFEDGASVLAHCLKDMQGLIFHPEPLPAYQHGIHLYQQHTANPEEAERSRKFNEFVVLRTMDAAWNMIHRPCEPWTELIKSHFASCLPDKIAVCEGWNFQENEARRNPKFPLFPSSDGFKEAVFQRLERFKKITPILARTKLVSPVIDVTADSESLPVNLFRLKSMDSVRQTELDISSDIVAAAASKTLMPEVSTMGNYKTPAALDSMKNVAKKGGQEESPAGPSISKMEEKVMELIEEEELEEVL